MVAPHCSRTIYAVGSLMASFFAACRVPQRDIPSEGNSGTLMVQLANLATEDQNKPAYIYNLSGCMPEVSGVLQPKDIVDFTAPGVTDNLAGCKLQIKTAKQLADRDFAAGADPLLLYSADVSDTFIDLDGELAAKAPLKKLYSKGAVGAQLPQQTQPQAPVPQSPPAPAPTPDPNNSTGTPGTATTLRMWQVLRHWAF